MSDRLDPTFVLREIENLKLAYPDVWNNPEDRPLALSTETDIDRQLASIAAEILRTEGEIEGTAKELTDLKVRRDRFNRRREAVRKLCMKIMERAEVNKWQLARATLSIRRGQAKVIITDEAALPPSCVRIKREPNREAIEKHLKNGDLVPGAEMSNAEPHLAITK